MTLKNLITVLVLGSSTVAAASSASAAPMRDNTWHGPVALHERPAPRPVVVRETRLERPIVTRPIIERPIIEHRAPERIVERPIVQRPIIRERFYAHRPAFYGHGPIVVDRSFVGSPFIAGQLVIGFNGTAADGVELASLGGATYVQQVAVQYTDGSSQVLQVNQELDRNNPTIDLQTDGNAIASIAIFGNGAAVSAAAF